MASIGTLFPTTTSTAASSAATQSTSSTTSASGSDSLSNQNTFLQLLVAQLQNQDPTQPMDGTTFVTQLATFSDLQANVGTKADMDGIAKQYLGTVPSSTSSEAATATSVAGTGSSAGDATAATTSALAAGFSGSSPTSSVSSS